MLKSQVFNTFEASNNLRPLSRSRRSRITSAFVWAWVSTKKLLLQVGPLSASENLVKFRKPKFRHFMYLMQHVGQEIYFSSNNGLTVIRTF